MLQGLMNSTAGALVQEARLNTVSNNMANLNTTGYKRDQAVFHHRLAEALENPELRRRANAALAPLGGGIYLADNWTDMRDAGSEVPTGNPMDLMLKGEGFFKLTDKDEQAVRYTRAGNFRLNNEGYITTDDGRWFPVNSRGNRIFAGQNSEVSFNGNRGIDINGEPADQIMAVNFKSKDLPWLRKEGENLFVAEKKMEEGEFNGSLLVEYLESSTVDMSREMVEMIQTQRNFDLNMRMITLQDQTLDRAVNQVGSVPL